MVRKRPDWDRLRAVLEPWEGQRPNMAAIGWRLGVSGHTVAAWLDAMEQRGLVRLIPFFGAVRRPLLSLRPASTVRGFWTEAVITRLQAILPDARCYWWKTGRVRRSTSSPTPGWSGSASAFWLSTCCATGTGGPCESPGRGA